MELHATSPDADLLVVVVVVKICLYADLWIAHIAVRRALKLGTQV